jgi:ATP-dependent DNA helicase RecG
MAARTCQRPETQIRDILNEMEQRLGYLERGGAGRGTYWTLRPEIYRRIAGPGHPERDRRIDWEAAKTRVLSILIERARRGDLGLSNQEIRQILRYNREQTKRLMRELVAENVVVLKGAGRGAKWEATNK